MLDEVTRFCLTLSNLMRLPAWLDRQEGGRIQSGLTGSSDGLKDDAQCEQNVTGWVVSRRSQQMTNWIDEYHRSSKMREIDSTVPLQPIATLQFLA
jgi:hypothetical protein